MDYSADQKIKIIERYLYHYNISYPNNLLDAIARKVDTVPRKIHNLVVTMRDYLITHHHNLTLDEESWMRCEKWLDIADG